MKMLDAGVIRSNDQRDPVAAGGIRPCGVDDIPAVARLFQTTFQQGRKAGGQSLELHLRRELFEHPWQDPRLPSLVFEGADGAVAGFIAVRPHRLLLDGEPVLAAVGGTLMVDKSVSNPLMGARLLRSYLNGPQDLSFSETANEISRSMWDRLGGRTEPAYSMEWLRILRPAAMAVDVLATKSRAATAVAPLARLFDRGAARLRANPLPVDPSRDRGEEVGESDFVDAVLPLSATYPLRPDWNRESLSWFVGQASEKERFGPPVRRIVRDRKGRPVGAYLYCVQPGAIAFVLDIFAAPKAAEEVVDDLIADAWRRGAIAVRGRVQPELADLLLRRKAVFVHASSMVVHTRRAELLAAIHSGDALITGLAGETWSALIGGLFS
ncbi:MAG: hypothetical protein KDJ86_15695 [Bauldia sp.]|uniref:hypothetical protein n=1 Tax=Bauldia sp. TaxID=2575872 RepID=UPI001D93BA2F|nr:hypothetical protein [Bauldia sp.]MCB1497232.1 hypothetical protein [Bauldia sp.]